MSVLKKIALSSIILGLSGITFPEMTRAESYWLLIGSYRQGPGSKPEVSGITSPTIYAIPMETLEQCNAAGIKITNEIYKPVWQFDNRWTCVAGK